MTVLALDFETIVIVSESAEITQCDVLVIPMVMGNDGISMVWYVIKMVNIHLSKAYKPSQFDLTTVYAFVLSSLRYLVYIFTVRILPLGLF